MKREDSELIFNPSSRKCNAPHLVILGAGASVASFPKGDINGRLLPLMSNLYDVVGLEDIVTNNFPNEKVLAKKNIEEFFDKIYENKDKKKVSRIEEAIKKYFSAMMICDEPTIYDKLILSLRKKDLIVSFNWDPLLLQAYLRIMKILSKYLDNIDVLPQILFLHGNVEVGVCIEHRRVGFKNGRCGKCGEIYQDSPLLFPISNKDYKSNPFIESQWYDFNAKLTQAFILTIFGYSAPVNDKAACDTIKKSWLENRLREFNEVEIVDIASESELINKWQDFFVREHYRIRSSFNDSLLSIFPRRSCDAFWGTHLQNEPWIENPIPRFNNIDKLIEWFIPLIHEEYIVSEDNPFNIFKKEN